MKLKCDCNMWWLISSETVEKVREALAASTHEANAYNCGGEQGGMECVACDGDGKRDEAYMLIDTGLHITDAVPDDYKTDISSRERIRELITCLMQRCDLKVHNEKDAKIISQFVKDFYLHNEYIREG